MDIINTKNLIPAYNRIIVQAGNIALRFVKDRFVQKDFLDMVSEPWQPRKRKDKGSLLVRTGTLKRSIRIVMRSPNRIVIGTDVPYASIHNEGGNISTTQQVRAHQRTRRGRAHQVKSFARNMNTTIPARPFLKESQSLETTIEHMMEIEISKVLNHL